MKLTLREAAVQSSVSLANLRKLERMGWLKFANVSADPLKADAEALRFHLSRNQALTVAQILMLLDRPELLDELPPKYGERASVQLAALGNAGSEAPSSTVTAYIADAARGDTDAAERLATWLKGALPARDVGHAWVAVRLLLGVPPHMRDDAGKAIPLALMHARKLLNGYFHKEGKATIYHQFRLTAVSL